MGNDWDTIEELIKTGKSQLAARALKDRLLRRREDPISRALYVRFASLCRRAGIPQLSIQLLNPIVRPRARRPEAATPGERAEYAAALLRLGAYREAGALLNAIRPGDFPQALLFEAIVKFRQWDYRAAIPILKEYLELADNLSPYDRLVGEVNFAAALAHEEIIDEAHPLLERLRLRASSGNHFLLLGNILEIQAQLHVSQGNWREAEAALAHARELLSTTAGADPLFVEKWLAILALKKEGPAPRTLKDLNTVRARAREMQHWETLRDCDFFEGFARGDASTLERLYFGTPYPCYRELIREKGFVPAKDHYDWEVGEGEGQAELPILDTLLGTSSRSSFRLKSGQLLQRALLCLSSDCYRPFRVAEIHELLFPKRFFNPVSSPQLVHQILFRLRKAVPRLRVPLLILEESESYRMGSSRRMRLRVYLQEKVLRSGQTEGQDFSALLRSAQLRDLLRSKLRAGEAFSIREAAELLKVPPRTVSRYMTMAVGAGWFERIDSGPATRYRFRRRMG